MSDNTDRDSAGVAVANSIHGDSEDEISDDRLADGMYWGRVRRGSDAEREYEFVSVNDTAREW